MEVDIATVVKDLGFPIVAALGWVTSSISFGVGLQKPLIL